jgi:hypothetical protein
MQESPAGKQTRSTTPIAIPPPSTAPLFADYASFNSSTTLNYTFQASSLSSASHIIAIFPGSYTLTFLLNPGWQWSVLIL